MIRKISLISIILIMLCMSLTAADNQDRAEDNSIYSISASGEDVGFRVSDTLACYHDFTVDHYWTGADSWAVRFDFRDYYNGVEAEFNAQAAWIYFPDINVPAGYSVKLLRDEVNQPDPEVAYFEETIAADQMEEGWNVVAFDNTYQDSVFWLVIDYETDNYENFMTGSAGDGEHSYFFQNESYYNFSAQGIESELLVCLEGSFIIDRVDLELLDFGFNQELEPTVSVSPYFVIRNDSDNYIDSVSVQFNVLYGTEYNSSTIELSGEYAALAPNQTYTFTFEDNPEFVFEISDEPAQYSFTGKVISSDDEFDSNNSVNITYEFLDVIKENYLIENITDLGLESNADIWSLQHEYVSTSGIDIINYFPEATDEPFYSIEAIERFDYYQLNGYPATVINGDNKIIGYWPDSFQEDFDNGLNNVLNYPYTWVVEDSIAAYYESGNDTVRIDVYFSNSNTRLLASYLNESVFQAYLVEDNTATDIYEISGAVFIHKLAEIAQFGDNYGTSFNATMSFRMSELPYMNSIDSCRIVYFIQNGITGRIDYFNSTDYIPNIDIIPETGSESSDIPNKQYAVKAYPNPFYGNEKMVIELPESSNRSENVTGRIYNIKGQLIRTFNSDEVKNSQFYWDGKDNFEKKSASGIYLVCLFNEEAKRKIGETKVVLLRAK